MTDDMIGRACSTHGIMRNSKLCSENLMGRDHFEDLDIDSRIILKEVLQKQGVGMSNGLG
jgi:hypothetical protein